MFLLSAFPITTAISKSQKGNILKATKTAPSWVLAYLNFAWGSAGTTVDVLIQTSYDGGASFFDFIYFAQLTTSSLKSVYLSNAAMALVPTGTAFVTPGTLSAGNANLIAPGSMFQALVTTTGTYATSTKLTVSLVADVPLSIANGAES
jgi:hypothetical protein